MNEINEKSETFHLKKGTNTLMALLKNFILLEQ